MKHRSRRLHLARTEKQVSAWGAGMIERFVMWRPSGHFLVKYHIAASVATLVCGVSIIVICLVPSYFPTPYRLLIDDRIAIIIPYVLFIALGEAIFSIWYFLFRKKD